MTFLIDVFWAILMVGVPVAAFTMAIVWWSLEKGHFSETLDSKGLEREIKAMSANKKDKKKKGEKTDDQPVEGKKLNPVQKKWSKFGGGFYGIVGLFTYLVIEFFEIIEMIRNLGGIFQFISKFGVDVIINLLISAFTNFITALIWPLYWLRRIETDQPWVWFVIAYLGYWTGLRLAQLLAQRKVKAES